MKERLSKLLTVKSIVTILLTMVFCFLSMMRFIDVDSFMMVFMVIISFYFTSQSEKNTNNTPPKE